MAHEIEDYALRIRNWHRFFGQFRTYESFEGTGLPVPFLNQVSGVLFQRYFDCQGFQTHEFKPHGGPGSPTALFGDIHIRMVMRFGKSGGVFPVGEIDWVGSTIPAVSPQFNMRNSMHV